MGCGRGARTRAIPEGVLEPSGATRPAGPPRREWGARDASDACGSGLSADPRRAAGSTVASAPAHATPVPRSRTITVRHHRP
jgi:hypothetical protein